ncbi:MAG: undecaprenyl-diphosphate phosphatase [Planctomycetota bacterium]
MDPITITQAIILGVVEGVTEYLPVSSTGHLIITAALLGLDTPAERKQAVDAFTIVIQGGAILAVLGLYRVRIAQMIRGLRGRDEGGRRLFVNLVVAFLPAMVLGALLNDWIIARLFHPGPVIAALALGGFAMILMGPWQRRFYHDPLPDHSDAVHSFTDIEHLTWRRALGIGLLQCVAMWPGTSRSLMTIVGGMLFGLRARHAAEFSFLLGLPTLGGACVYRVVRDLISDEPSMFSVLGGPELLVGIVVAFIAAAVAIKWFVHYLSAHGIALFGWYRLALCAVLVVLLLRGTLTIAP